MRLQLEEEEMLKEEDQSCEVFVRVFQTAVELVEFQLPSGHWGLLYSVERVAGSRWMNPFLPVACWMNPPVARLSLKHSNDFLNFEAVRSRQQYAVAYRRQCSPVLPRFDFAYQISATELEFFPAESYAQLFESYSQVAQ
jgi:hypothetical protein